MSRKTLPRRFFVPAGFRKDGRPIFPIAGGSEPLTAEQQAAAAATAAAEQQAAAAAAANSGPVEATDESGAKLGFPKDTPVAQMKAEEQAAYWRNQTKIQQGRVPKNLTELEENARKWAEFQQSQQTPSEQAIQKARDEAAAAARKEAAADSTTSLLRVTLQSRGKEQTEIDEIVDPIDPTKFLTAEGKVDTGKVLAFVDKLAPASSGGGGGGGFGQGRGYGSGTVSKRELGVSEAQKRFSNQKNDPNRGSLGGLSR